MDGKGNILLPGVVSLTNYRNHFNRPVYGSVPYGVRAGSPNARRGINRQRYQPPRVYDVARRVGNRIVYNTMTSVSTRTKPKKKYRKKKVCCLYLKGKKVCKPKFCPKKKRFYRRKFFYW